ncbi:DEAD/DEAH box helicase [Pendulispora albinea]|uniref:DEAD/DEAH box helicase n=1 Tax=Pendulispora albinea TaxID=2741071 RepID=A0ABZ2M4Q4_9BACT
MPKRTSRLESAPSSIADASVLPARRAIRDDGGNPLSAFHEPVRTWFEGALGKPTRAQVLAWAPIARGESTLLLAPTGSGKTLAAFLWAIDALMWTTPPSPPKSGKRSIVRAPANGLAPSPRRGIRVLYISPLKALAVDVQKNLRTPLSGVLGIARERETVVHEPTVLVRTGDTPPKERAQMRRTPPDILITTPESLYLMLTSAARSMLADVETVILDEIHQLVPTKRGAHLALSLERLEVLREKKTPVQRIGLSATQRPLDEVSRLLGGLHDGKPRPVTIVDASEPKRIELRVEAPQMPHIASSNGVGEYKSPSANGSKSASKSEHANGGPPGHKSAASSGPQTVWPEVHERLLGLIAQHRSTMVFVNSRRLAERLAAALNERAGAEIALAHHGSLALEKRTAIEDRLKYGELPAIVATSSLELGIDMGAVDLVVQIEAPPSIASGIQRVGRAGHTVAGTSTGVLIPKHRADLLACAAASAAMRAGEVEETFYPRSPLDVLAQQIVAIVALEPTTEGALYALVRRAAPYADLPRSAFDGVLDMLSGRYPSDEFAGLRPRLTWDRKSGKISARTGAHALAIANAGTIPDRGLYGVFLNGGEGAGRRVGELDEEMVFELRLGDVFLLGASSWRVDEITTDKVLVSPAAGHPGKMPFWRGDRAGRSHAFGAAIGELTRLMAKLAPDAAALRLEKKHGLDTAAAQACVQYVRDQLDFAGEVPSDKALVIERFVDEVGDFRISILSPFGSRVHAPWATCVIARLRAEHAGEADVIYNDDGIVFRVTGTHEPPKSELFLPPSESVEELITGALGQSALFAARFRENAARALLLPRRQIGKRTPLWAQRRRARDLLSVAARFPSFPILLETYRECLRDVFDLPGLIDVLQRIETRKMRVVTIDTDRPSPFAASLLFMFVGNFMYENDAPLAERRAQALTIDHVQLRELLGEDELRKLLDPELVREHEQYLQHLTYPARHLDGLHDLFLAVGDLTLSEVHARVDSSIDADTVRAWLEELVNSRRIIAVEIAGQKRYAAIEDASRLRDAVGVALPRGIAFELLDPVADPVGDLVARYARTHGPFTADAVAERFGWGPAVAIVTLERLIGEGRVVQGAFTVGREEISEYCDAEVLRALRRKALARLRREVEPVDADALGRFLPAWQGVGRRRRGPEALLSAIAQLEGCPIPASVLESEILPARVEGFRPWDLDALCASGEVTWAGVESLGANDGRIALYLAENEPLLALARTPCEGKVHQRIRDYLNRRGAVFFKDIARELGGFPTELKDALWDMVWAGEITNDTLEPLRSLQNARASEERHRHRRGSFGGTPGTEGRWSLRTSSAPDTARRVALARALLERYGVVTREAVQAERITGGFSAVYDVFKAMEEAGKIRRGYFIAGQGATQFALPGADDRLRSFRATEDEPRCFILAATDPSNPYGAILPWPAAPDTADNRTSPKRIAGAYVIVYDGKLVGYLARSADSLMTFLPSHEPLRGAAERALVEGLGRLVDSGQRKVLFITTIDGASANASPMASAFTRAGFRFTGLGFMRRRTLEVDGEENA